MFVKELVEKAQFEVLELHDVDDKKAGRCLTFYQSKDRMKAKIDCMVIVRFDLKSVPTASWVSESTQL